MQNETQRQQRREYQIPSKVLAAGSQSFFRVCGRNLHEHFEADPADIVAAPLDAILRDDIRVPNAFLKAVANEGKACVESRLRKVICKDVFLGFDRAGD